MFAWEGGILPFPRILTPHKTTSLFRRQRFVHGVFLTPEIRLKFIALNKQEISITAIQVH